MATVTPDVFAQIKIKTLTTHFTVSDELFAAVGYNALLSDLERATFSGIIMEDEKKYVDQILIDTKTLRDQFVSSYVEATKAQ